MQSRNPILNNSDTFNGRAAQTNGYQRYSAAGQSYRGYGQVPPQSTEPSTWGYPTGPALGQPMTIDSVVSRTALTLLLVVATAAATWVFLPDGSQPGQANYVGVAWIGGALVGAGLGLVLSFKRVISPALVVLYAVAQGFFLGAASEAFQQMFPGVVAQAVMGTVAAFAATLAAYKFFDIQVSSRFRKFVVIAGMGFFVVTFFDFILYQFGASIGFNDLGGLGLIMSFLGLALGIFYLILDFDMIEQGVAAGAPEQESWRAAFALTAALILIYVELLRILAIMRGD
ncbi:MAG: Bax inhibitor-1/YccA family protein [Propionibacteriales bacterium]|nr:Bax inhibitor-1/YccA family protein [Propionibacteriales bacterium]